MTAKKQRSLADMLRNELQVEEPKNSASFFSEEPVSLDTFIYDNRFMRQKDIRLSKYQFDLIRHMEQIYLPEMYPFMVQEFGDYWVPVRYVNELAVQWGKGGGKDFCVSMAVARIAYLLLCLNSPQNYFGLAEQSDIHILNVATNSDQARRAFFRPLSNAVKNSSWFAENLANDITDQARAIRLQKQVELISGHSEMENFEGLSPIAVVLDEISGFQSEDQKASKGIVESQRTAEAVYDIAFTSASTRFPKNFKVAAISYPRYINDPIQERCAIALKDIEENGLENSRYYVDGPRATWDVNPRYDAFERIEIPQTDVPIPDVPAFRLLYGRNRAKARSMYECKPERSVNRFFRNESAIAAGFPKQEDDWNDPVKVSYHWGIDTEGAKAEDSYVLAVVPGWNASFDIDPSLKPMEGAVYALHVDLAISSDRAGIAMCHVKNWERREHPRGPVEGKDYQDDNRPVVKVDFVTCFEADMQAVTPEGEVVAREINPRWARNLIRELKRRGFVIGLVTFDNFQSHDSIKIIETWGILAEKLSVDTNNIPYTTFRDILYDGRIEGHYNELLVKELQGLGQLPNGKIDHPPGGSKDLADAVCGAITDSLRLGGDEGEIPEEVNLGGPNSYEMSPIDITGGLGINDPLWQGVNLGISQEDWNFIRG